MSLFSEPLTHRLLAKPVKVYWRGWETDTYRLQQEGWELSMDQDVCQMRMRMVVRHREAGFMGQTNDIPLHLAAPYGVERAYGMETEPRHIWQMQHMGRSIMVRELGPISGYANFRAVDAKPQLAISEVKCLEDLVPFPSAPLIRNQALILPEASVDDLLAGILERQQEAKLAYFEDLVRKDGEQERAPTKFHCQIISLGDYREAA